MIFENQTHFAVIILFLLSDFGINDFEHLVFVKSEIVPKQIGKFFLILGFKF